MNALMDNILNKFTQICQCFKSHLVTHSGNNLLEAKFLHIKRAGGMGCIKSLEVNSNARPGWMVALTPKMYCRWLLYSPETSVANLDTIFDLVRYPLLVPTQRAMFASCKRLLVMLQAT